MGRRQDGTLPPAAAPEEPACARLVGGRPARSQSRSYYSPPLKDTLFFSRVLLAAAPDLVLSAHAGGYTRAVRHDALAALAAAQFEAPPPGPTGDGQRRSAPGGVADAAAATQR